MPDRNYFTGLFVDRRSAERAYQGALDRGYKTDELDVVMSDETRTRQFAPEDVDVLIDTSSGLLGGVLGWNIPEERVKHYVRGVAQGGILVCVRLRNEDDAVHLERQWRDADGVDICRWDWRPARSGSAGDGFGGCGRRGHQAPEGVEVDRLDQSVVKAR